MWTGSALSPLLLTAVVQVISRKASTKDILRKLIYADDLQMAVVVDSEADLQERLVEWKEIFGRLNIWVYIYICTHARTHARTHTHGEPCAHKPLKRPYPIGNRCKRIYFHLVSEYCQNTVLVTKCYPCKISYISSLFCSTSVTTYPCYN